MGTHTAAVNALIILDGWGINPETKGNAVALADTPFLDSLLETFPHSTLGCHGNAVGLPDNTMGNSEVGHMNIGAGRKVMQDLVRINTAIEDRSFFKNEVLLSLMEKIKAENACLHLMGLLSDGGVHSHISHLYALIDMAETAGVRHTFIHAITDGRDTPPRSGIGYITQLQAYLETKSRASIASICGRYWAMDRDTRWDRVQKAYQLFTRGRGFSEKDPETAVKNAYSRNETDEFISPVIIDSGEPGNFLKDKDGVVFFNFRADRAKQITTALTSNDFSAFERDLVPQLCEFVCFTQYDESYDLPVAYGPEHLSNILGEILSNNGLTQLRIAETEKYAHVTYFFNGGDETVFHNEERLLIPSPRDVATYDKKPEMSARKVAETAVEKIKTHAFDFLVLNFANMDMVGHTGILEAAITACETVDECVKKVVEQIWETNGWAVITADHGNAEMMLQKDGSPHTAHTLNPVRFILAGKQFIKTPLKDGILGDIAPTVLALLDIEKPDEMKGNSLI